MPFKRPPLSYFLLLTVALLAWVLFSFQNLLPAVLILIAVILSYKIALPPFKLEAWQWGLCFVLSCIFAYFILYSGEAQRLISIYSEHWVYSLSFGLACLAALQWYARPAQYFDWLLFSLGLLLMLSGISWQSHQHKLLYLWLVLCFCFIVLAKALLDSGLQIPQRLSRPYFSAIAVVMAVFLGLGYVNIRSIEYLDQRVDELMSRYLSQNNSNWSGFSGFTQLRGQQEIQLSQRIAFTVKSSEALEYWRGNVLTHYQKGQWFPKEILQIPLQRQREHDKQVILYPQNTRAAEALKSAQVEMRDHFQGIVFLPSGTREVRLPPEAKPYQNQYQLLRRELERPEHSYRVNYRKGPTPALYDMNMLKENLGIAPELRAQLRPLALQVVGNAQSAQEKAQRLESWFHQNFHYSLKTGHIPKGQDPTVDFILNRRAAWCSWFASGMTLMLRSLNVPAHVVSGWRSMDYNPLLKLWVVKEKEAHDWVEVLDRQQQVWLRFDPTPPGEIAELTGSGAKASTFRQLLDSITLALEMVQKKIQNMEAGDWLQLLQGLALASLKHPAFYLILALFLGLNLWLKHRRSRPRAGQWHYSQNQRAAENHRRLKRWAEKHALPAPYTPYGHWLEAVQQLADQSDLVTLVDLLRQQRYDKLDAHEAPLIQERIEALFKRLESLEKGKILSSGRDNQSIEI